MNKWIPVTTNLYPKDEINVQVTYLGYYDNIPRCDEFAYRKDGSWYWALDDSNVNVKIIAWRDNDKPYSPSDNDIKHDDLKDLTETEALIHLIEEMKEERLKDKNWEVRDEQILVFLTELYILRMSFIHTFKELKDVLKIVNQLQDDFN